ncbi:MAG TPA: DUF2306 domain-containing protein [Candidatus Tectomicrobia bacterium]|nr:DUF2306 domain-containing protein [Candidatus Tectomicrobia bacterium]
MNEALSAAASKPGTSPRPVPWRLTITLALVAVVAAGFLVAFAVPYVVPDAARAAFYASRRGWLLLHIAAGAAALLAGPVQLWLGLAGRHLALHRQLGRAYASSVAVGAVAALYLAFHTTFGWVFGMGLTGLAIAWIVTTGLAVAAIRRGQVHQHREWMIRSYVVTFAFVTFRLFVGVLQAAGVGTQLEQFAAASWFCWAVPLLVTEAILQGRKIAATGSAHAVPPA